MTVTILVAVAVVLAAVLFRAFIVTPPADLARRLKIGGGVALMATGGGLLLLRQFALAVPVGVAGFMIVRRNALPSPSPSATPKSSVRTAGLEMSLDRESGDMDGRVLAGRHQGRLLSELEHPELLQVADDFRGDANSLRLLEGYLDRTQPGWREDVQADQTGRHGAAAGAGSMDTHEAYKILGLEPHSSEAEVREAHRRLMKQVHPDRGGTAALAARINEAKDRILGKHR